MKNDQGEAAILRECGAVSLMKFQKMVREGDYPEPEEAEELANGRVPPSLARRLRPPEAVSRPVSLPRPAQVEQPSVTKVSAPSVTKVSDGLWVLPGTRYELAQDMWDRFWRSEAQRLSSSGRKPHEVAELLGVSRSLVVRWLKKS